MGVSSKLGNLGVVTTTLDAAVNWGRTGAMWPLLFGLACCAIEYMGTQGSSYDLSRFGMNMFIVRLLFKLVGRCSPYRCPN